VALTRIQGAGAVSAGREWAPAPRHAGRRNDDGPHGHLRGGHHSCPTPTVVTAADGYQDQLALRGSFSVAWNADRRVPVSTAPLPAPLLFHISASHTCGVAYTVSPTALMVAAE
jgi:hypothetical protein